MSLTVPPLAFLQHCPKWEYKSVPKHGEVLRKRVDALLLRMAHRQMDVLEVGPDPRPLHAYLFEGLTQTEVDGKLVALHPHLAGHYRGEDLPCLRERWANVARGDRHLGARPFDVARQIDALGNRVRDEIAVLDRMATRHMTGTENLRSILSRVAFSAAMLHWEFCYIHPFANGNGHIARIVTWLVFTRYGFWPVRFTIEPRPRSTAFLEALRRADAARDFDPLAAFLVEACV